MENEELLMNEDIEPTHEPFVIPKVYNYNPDTKEFTGVIEQADKDNAKSAQVGHFVPLVHANATLLEPPECGENQIQVYSKEVIEHEVVENWTMEADYRKNFYKVDNDLNVSEIDTIGEQEGYIVVDKETGEAIKANRDWYKIVDNEVIKKSDEEYEQEQYDRREAVFHKEFFNTSLGYIRRSVTMANGSHKDFLSDLLPTIAMAVNTNTPVTILAYDQPDFTKPVTDWTQYQHAETVTAQFVQECFMRLQNDFIPQN